MSNPKNSFSDNPNLKKLSGKQQELGELAASADGQKIRQLLGDEQVIKYAVENGCPYLRIDTNELNANARSLYRKLGYKEVGIFPCEFNGLDKINLVLLEKMADQYNQ